MTRARTISRSTLWLVLAILGLVGFGAMTVLVANHQTDALDKPLLAAAVQAGSGLDGLWNALSTFGNYPMIPIAIAFVLWLIWTKERREALVVIAILVVVSVATELVKGGVARERPLGSAPAILGLIYSFPSGHSLEDVMILGMVAVRLWRSGQPGWLKVGVALLVVVESILVGFARLALQVHYPSDILAGYFGGLAALGTYAWLTRPGSWAARAGPIRARRGHP
ncbi:MAG TPA: phosphatase PAP2 family protein [Candidatus Limnocylindrales bacterium]